MELFIAVFFPTSDITHYTLLLDAAEKTAHKRQKISVDAGFAVSLMALRLGDQHL